jgi:hypothetical protein
MRHGDRGGGGFGIGGAAQGEHGSGALGRRARLQHPSKVREQRTRREWTHAPPQFRAHLPAGGPAFMRVVAEHAREGGIGPAVQTDDRGKRTADEERLQHHLVPGIFRQLLGRIGIAVCDRLEHHLHVRAQAFGRAQAMAGRIRVDRQAAVQHDQLGDVGRRAELREERFEALARVVQREQQIEPGCLVDGEPVRSPAGTRRLGCREFRVREGECRLAGPAGHESEGHVEFRIPRSVGQSLGLRREPLHRLGCEPRAQPDGKKCFGGHAACLRVGCRPALPVR